MTWRDGATGRTTLAEVPNATLDLGGGRARVQAQAQVLGTDMRLEATLGTWAQMTATPAVPFPVKLAASVGDATVALDGQVDSAAHGVAGRLEAAVPDLARFGTVLGRPGLPPLHDVRFAGTLLPAGGLPQDVVLQAGPSDLATVLPGATLSRLSLTWPAGQAARLEAEGGVYGGPWHVASGVLPAGQGVALRALALTSPFGDLTGDLAVQVAPRPSVRGTLVSTRLDMDAVRGALRPTPAPAAAPAPAPAAVAPAVPAPIRPAPVAGPVVSTAPLPWAVLRQADSDLQLTAATVRWGGVDYHGATGHLALQDGVARLDPASVVTPAGRVDLSASADARAAAPPVALVLRSAGVSLDAVLQAAGLPGGSDATAELDVALHAAGASPHALAATVGGHVGIAVVDGEIANAALGVLLGDVMKQAGAGFDPGGRSHIRCLAVRADAETGVVTLTALKLDTARLELEGGGTVNLGDETMALHLRPLLRLGGAGVSAPIRVEGGLRHPVVSLDPAGRAHRRGDRRVGRPLRQLRRGVDGGAGRPCRADAAGGGGRRQAAEGRRPAAEFPAVKRVWTTARAAEAEGGWGVLLDGKPLRIPSGPPLLVPQPALAAAVAAEWQAAGAATGEMEYTDVPLTRLAGTAQLRIVPDPAPTVSAIAAYGETDLLCYRADRRPSWCCGRTRRGARGWTGRGSSWARRWPPRPASCTSGSIPAALAALHRAVAAEDGWVLAGLGIVVPALGSLVLGLAVARGGARAGGRAGGVLRGRGLPGRAVGGGRAGGAAAQQDPRPT